jgi:RNA polymerase sigma-70 factor (ECF subfamily)
MAVKNFSEAAFLERLKTRDPAALAEVADAYLPQLLRAGRGMGFAREESEDLAQAVFAAFLDSLERFEARSHIRTFLFGIFYNKVSEHLREKQRAQLFDPIDEVMESRFDARGNWRQPGVDIEKQLLAQEIRQIIQQCLETIPHAQRIAFYLREIEEMKTPEICKKMGITATNLGVLLFRARNRLCLCVEQKGLRGFKPCTPAEK